MPSSSTQLRLKESAELRIRFMRTKPTLISFTTDGLKICVSPRVCCT